MMVILKRTRSAPHRLVVVGLASVAVLAAAVLGVNRPWLSTSDPHDGPDCGGWNSKDFFKNARAIDVENCLRMGADIHARTAEGITPVLWAAMESEDPDVVRVLVRAGVDINEIVKVQGGAGTPLLVAAGRSDGAAMTKALLMKGANANQAVHDGMTPLHAAASRAKNTETLTLLLKHGADPGALDADGRTPLTAAVAGNRFGDEQGHGGRVANVISVIRVLLENGGAVADLARHGWSELHTVALLGTDPEEVATLVDDGFDPNAKTSSGWTALHLAAFGNKNPAIVATLLDMGADVGARFGDGRTPLHCAAFGNANPLLVTTLLRAGAEPDARTMTGWTPLHAAAFSNANPGVVSALLSGGADANVWINERWTLEHLFPDSLSVRGGRDPIDLLIMLDGQTIRLHRTRYSAPYGRAFSTRSTGGRYVDCRRSRPERAKLGRRDSSSRGPELCRRGRISRCRRRPERAE